MQEHRIFRISSTLGSNVYFVNTTPSVIIDTGHPSFKCETIDSLSENVSLGSVRYIFCTHSHPDHTGAAAFLKQLTNADILARSLEPSPKVTTAHTSLLNLKCENFKIDVFLDESPVIEMENEKIRVIHSPGHADDHICLYFAENRSMFSGDLFTFSDIGFFNLNKHYSLSLTEFTNSIRYCRELKPEIIYPGHGPAFSPDDTFWRKVERKLSLFGKNPYLLIPHTIISPLLFFLGTREQIPEQECEEYIVSHTFLFEGFLDNVSTDRMSSEFRKLISLLQLRGILARKNGLSLISSPHDYNSAWI